MLKHRVFHKIFNAIVTNRTGLCKFGLSCFWDDGALVSKHIRNKAFFRIDIDLEEPINCSFYPNI